MFLLAYLPSSTCSVVPSWYNWTFHLPRNWPLLAHTLEKVPSILDLRHLQKAGGVRQNRQSLEARKESACAWGGGRGGGAVVVWELLRETFSVFSTQMRDPSLDPLHCLFTSQFSFFFTDAGPKEN